MLVSAGPTSHLSQFSLLCGPASRVLIRQPSRDVVEAGKEHSPLSGKPNWSILLRSCLSERVGMEHGGIWMLHNNCILSRWFETVVLKSDFDFLGTIPESIPLAGPFWTGALSSDLLHLTLTFRLLLLTLEGELLCVLWEIHHCIVHQKSTDSLVVLSTDPGWEGNVRAALERGLQEYPSPTVRLSQKPTSTCTD